MQDKPAVSLISTIATPSLPFTGEPRLVYVLFELRGNQTNQQLPVDIALVIDCSESMRIRLVNDEQFADLVRTGQVREVMTDGVPAFQISSVSNPIIEKYPRRLDYVIQALRIASKFLRPIDRFSLVAFADRSHTLIPSSLGSERSRLIQASRELEYLKLGDGTNIASGIASAFAQLSSIHDQPFTKRIILLTDGHTRHVRDCYDWAQRARQEGLPLTTMGVGSEFNEELLIPLADVTGGNAYYIENPDQIPNAFRQELGVAFRINLHNVRVNLNLANGVTIRNAYQVSPELGPFDRINFSNGNFQFLLGDYDPDLPPALLLEFLTPAWNSGSHRLISSQLVWENPDHSDPSSGQIHELLIHVQDEPPEYKDLRVINIVERVAAYKLGMHALDNAKADDNQINAILRLNQAAARLAELGESHLADSLIRQAKSLEQVGSLNPDETKKIRYETRHLVRQLSNKGETRPSNNPDAMIK